MDTILALRFPTDPIGLFLGGDPQVREDLPEVRYTEQVIVMGQLGQSPVEAQADTGAERTSIDMDLAAEIGAGPIVRTTFTRSAGSRRKRILARVQVNIGGRNYPVEAAVDDRSRMSFKLLIGRDILKAGKFSVIPSED